MIVIFLFLLIGLAGVSDVNAPTPQSHTTSCEYQSSDIRPVAQTGNCESMYLPFVSNDTEPSSGVRGQPFPSATATPTATPRFTPTATPTPEPHSSHPVEVHNHRLVELTDGKIAIFGEVTNNGSRSILNVSVPIYLSTGKKEKEQRVFGHVWMKEIRPGATSCFMFYHKTRDPIRYRVSRYLMYGIKPADVPSKPFLSVTDLSLHPDRPGFGIRGSLRNDSGRTVDKLIAVISIYDRQGNIVRCGPASPNRSTVRPWETMPFSVLFPLLNGDDSQYLVKVQGVAEYR